MINNLQQILKLLVFSSTDDFYHLQIIKRKKEHPELGSNSYIVKTYYISSVDYLDKKIEEIIVLCNYHNARACINLNRRSYEKCAYQLLRKVADQILNKDFRSCRKAYESVCGLYSNEPVKKWIIDIDVHNPVLVDEITQRIDTFDPVGPKYIATLSTKAGCHIICNPFNIQQWNKYYINIDIHKDNPTVLYIP